MRRLRPRRTPCRSLLRLRRRPHLMNMPGGLVRIHALGATLTLKHGSHANGGKQAHQSMPLDEG
eukprot:2884506-Pyramimonas_sp.AAC.1